MQRKRKAPEKLAWDDVRLFLEIDPGEAVLDLTRREADLALRTVRPVKGDLVVTSLGTVRWVLAAAPALAKKLGACFAGS